MSYFKNFARTPFSNSRTTPPRVPTPLLNELLLVHPPTHHLVHHIGLGLTDTRNLAHKPN